MNHPWSGLKTILFLLYVAVPVVFAADIRLDPSGSFVIEGRIEAGDFSKLVTLVKDNPEISGVVLYSPGGDFEEAMKIGRFLRQLEMSTVVPFNVSGKPICEGLDLIPSLPPPKDPKNCICASACFFIHIGSVDRAGGFLAVHRPYFVDKRYGKLSEAEASRRFDSLQRTARIYMKEMGVPSQLQENVLGTSSDDVLILDLKTVFTYFAGLLPARYEWLKSRCSRLNPEEETRLADFKRRIGGKSHDSPDIHLSEEELIELGKLANKENTIQRCITDYLRYSRAQAYEKYFGHKPDLYAKYDFSKWVNAPKYLGRTFDDVKGQDSFLEEKSTFRGQTFGSLKSKESKDSPEVMLFDYYLKRRIVDRITLLSAAPTEGFM